MRLTVRVERPDSSEIVVVLRPVALQDTTIARLAISWPMVVGGSSQKVCDSKRGHIEKGV